RTWLSAKADSDAIPYGAIEGVGLSDPTKLVENHGWSETLLVNAYVGLGAVLLLLLAVRYALGLQAVWSARGT
ncbi:MAG: hypothetical protein ACT4TC_00170, partial [Myxococcaceae bacterium]